MKEQWKKIDGWPYEVSNLGMVRNIRTGRMIARCVQKRGGYLAVHLHQNNKRKCFALHRLVAKAFIPNPENKPQVNHIDFDRQNCEVSNLEWATAQENSDHSEVNRSRGADQPHATHTTEQVRMVKALIDRGWRTKDIALTCGTHATFVSKVRYGVIWNHI